MNEGRAHLRSELILQRRQCGNRQIPAGSDRQKGHGATDIQQLFRLGTRLFSPICAFSLTNSILWAAFCRAIGVLRWTRAAFRHLRRFPLDTGTPIYPILDSILRLFRSLTIVEPVCG